MQHRVSSLYHVDKGVLEMRNLILKIYAILFYETNQRTRKLADRIGDEKDETENREKY